MRRMPEDVNMLTLVHHAARIKMLFLPHALQQMMRPDRMISRHDIRSVVEVGDVIEDYPADPRGHSCLLLGFGADGRAIHVVCSPREDYLAVITAYLPDTSKWSADFRTRTKK